VRITTPSTTDRSRPRLRRRSRIALIAAAGIAAAGTAGVVAAPASSAATPVVATYVAFGDSYSAGPGLTERASGAEIKGCQTAVNNWPSDIASYYGLTYGSTFRDFSCSGAVTGVGTGTQTTPTTLATEISTAITDGALGSATKDVTIMISGDDEFASADGTFKKYPLDSPAGLTAYQCLPAPNQTFWPTVSADCSVAAKAAPSAWLQPAELTTTAEETKLIAALERIRAATPAKILLVGYPTILPAATGCTDNVNTPKLWDDTPGESVYVNSLFTALNNAESATAAAANSYAPIGNTAFVNLRAMSVGHTICDGAAHWIEPIKLAQSPTFPYLYTVLNPGSGHPNPAGMSAFATTVEGYVAG
jgi:hypothetical protein